MIEELGALVDCESPSADAAATRSCAGLVDDLFARHLGSRGRWVGDERGHLLWSGGGDVRVLLLGHVDTVWPAGTTQRWPFSVAGGVATGPGCFDMKAGLVLGIHALAGLDDLTGVAFLVTTDEEVGSPTSRALVEDTARGADAVLVLEPAADGAVKTARKGVSLYELVVEGRAAHAGLEPEKGANAAVELAHQILALGDLARPGLGTTVTPTVLSGGTTVNTVPASARVAVDVRVAEPAEQERVDAELRRFAATVPGCSLDVRGGPNRPPLPPSASAALFARAQRVAETLGLAPLEHVAVGGASDGNFTAGLGVPTLDGLGAVGAGAHAEGEHVVVDATRERVGLLRGLVANLLAVPAHERRGPR
ncbi:MAG: glutamate carboxypeptidase [Frankiaceae bacterium]|nr:glutamate carboxypeptidase [Frankiaceae bacterium]